MPPKKAEPVAEPAPEWADEGLEVIKEDGVRGTITCKDPWQIQWEDGTIDDPVLVWVGTVQAAPAWAAKGVKVITEPGALGWIVSTEPWQVRWQTTGSIEAVTSWTEMKMVPKTKGHFVLLALDAMMPINSTVLGELCAYVEAFFGRELKVVEVPVTPVAPDCPSGWEAMKERCNTALQSKPGRQGAVAPRQLLSSQLLHCLQLVQEDPIRYGVDTDGAEHILGITLNEFYHDPAGLRPDEPVPEERTKDFFIRKGNVGVCSVSQLDFCDKIPAFTSSLQTHGAGQKLPKQIFKLVSSCLLALLGLKNCSSHQCCAYMKPFALDVTPLALCFRCEEAVLMKLYPGPTHDLIEAAATRYNKLREILTSVSHRLKSVVLGHRRYMEFEEECDWMQVAAEILTEISEERFRYVGTDGPQNRRRSLHVCLREAHDRQGGRTLHRVMSEPLIKRTCLLDMTKSAPYRHECGELNKWTTMLKNKSHKVGGHYVETGGSLRPKTIGAFVDSGLNASLVQKVAPAMRPKDELRLSNKPVPSGQLPQNLDDLSDFQLTTICGQHRMDGLTTRPERLAALKNIELSQSVRENRLNKRHFYGTDIWRNSIGGSHKEALRSQVANAQIGPRGGDPKVTPEDWKPVRSLKNVQTMNYTVKGSFASTGALLSNTA